MSYKAIKFGTDGWRAIIAREFTIENLERVVLSVSKWIIKNHEGEKKPSVVIGYDCRFGGEMFSKRCAEVFASMGIRAYLSNDFASTPMVSFGATRLKTDLGIVITASHNPPIYNGFKLKGSYGGPGSEEMTNSIESGILDAAEISTLTFDEYIEKDLATYIDLEEMYIKHIEANFDLDAIKNSNLKLGYDAMYGAGQAVMKKILPNITCLHAEFNPYFNGTPPEPLLKNLKEFQKLIIDEKLDSGLATDGDADRLGLFDEKGNFVSSHHIILLLIHYMWEYKKIKGKVCTAFSSTNKIKKLCDHYGLELEVVKIGFKHICQIMLKDDVIVGGEESGGIAVTGHIPERDGIYIGLLLWEFMAKTGKTLSELMEEVYAITGRFSVERNDMHINEELKNRIVENCKQGKYDAFGDLKVEKIEDLDGFKYHLGNDEWVMIRPSGTEPILRTYAEAESLEKSLAILKTTEGVLLGS